MCEEAHVPVHPEDQKIIKTPLFRISEPLKLLSIIFQCQHLLSRRSKLLSQNFSRLLLLSRCLESTRMLSKSSNILLLTISYILTKVNFLPSSISSKLSLIVAWIDS
ncbi:hypothetical protein KFK09_017240 [Dendrobium nobile]|uniref:Uncharacterized protein n=1 Tax=Dendrobium nobile TaxID=94219 RepID=A0A8T3B0H0_DENNO|nr:hypothetical protein KFK09_017240 [Dendrobium nobile]